MAAAEPESSSREPGPDRATVLGRSASLSAWSLYALIVLEILFMVSPFAAYYYAGYGVPLNALADHPWTAWLTWQVLPHFTHSSSVLANSLILMAWPMILLGLLLFALGCVQIYGARFRGRGAVTSGLYRSVRHPQYLALALVGFGAMLYWSRFLVVAAYVLMLTCYGILARIEEARCLRRFGAAYAAYLAKTGRFLPRRWEQALATRLPRLRVRGRLARGFALAGLIGILLAVALTGAWLLRQHVLASLQVGYSGDTTAVYLAPLERADRERVLELVTARFPDAGTLLYIVPEHWTVPELGLVGSSAAVTDGFSSATTHGNRGGFDRTRIRVLGTDPELSSPAAPGTVLLGHVVRVAPRTLLTVDLTTGEVTEAGAPGPGYWQDVVVPAF